MRHLAALAVGLTIAVTGCSNSTSDDPPDNQPKPPARVSVQTTCDQLFIDDDPRLWSQAVHLVKKAQAGQAWEFGEGSEVARQLKEAAESSGNDLRPFVEQMATAMSIEDGGTLDAGAFKTAAREVANICTPYVAADPAAGAP